MSVIGVFVLHEATYLMSDIHNQLARLERIKSELSTMNSLDTVADLRDKAAALRAYAKSTGETLECQNRLAAIRIGAERRAGELLAEMEKNKGTRGQLAGSSIVRPPEDAPTLSDLGINKSKSSRWQKIASIPDEVFEKFIEETIRKEQELTSKAVVSLAKKQSGQSKEDKDGAFSDGCSVDDLQKAADLGVKFGCIYADPPWQYGNQGTRAATDNHYDTMTIEQIAALPIAELAADDAHLHLWTTNGFLFESKAIMEAWGFEYKSCRVWVKPQMGLGNYWRLAHEFLLLGVRGNAGFDAADKMSWLQADRLKHSKKPYIFRKDIEEVSPGPRLELFGREESPGWVVWGNEVSRNLFSESLPS